MKTKFTAVIAAKRLSALVAAMLMAFFVMSSVACAVPVRWRLVDIVFDDGGIASGSYVFDADTNSFPSIDIHTSAGSSLPGYTYVGPHCVGCTDPVGAQIILFNVFPDPGGPLLSQMVYWFAAQMTNAGGTIPIVTKCDTYVGCGASYEYGTGIGTRYVISGSISSTPLPSTLPLLATGLGVLGLLGWRRKRKAKLAA